MLDKYKKISQTLTHASEGIRSMCIRNKATRLKQHYMSNYIYPRIINRHDDIINAWSQIAPEESFAGMTLAQYTATSYEAFNVRNRIGETKATLSAQNQELKLTDDALREIQRTIINAVRGHLQYGENSPLYRALGYTPRNRRESGLSRKVSTTTPVPSPIVAA